MSRPNDVPLLGLSSRIPPSNIAAEQALLGALMANNKACQQVGSLQPRHFADPVHRLIFESIIRDYRKGKVVDAITLRAELGNTGALNEVGGSAYLAQLVSQMHGIINAHDYADSIRDAWLRRELVDVGEEIVNNAFGADPEMDGDGQVQEALRRLGPLNSSPDYSMKAVAFGQMRGLCRSAARELEYAATDAQDPHQARMWREVASNLREAEQHAERVVALDRAASALPDGHELVAGRVVDMREPRDESPLGGAPRSGGVDQAAPAQSQRERTPDEDVLSSDFLELFDQLHKMAGTTRGVMVGPNAAGALLRICAFAPRERKREIVDRLVDLINNGSFRGDLQPVIINLHRGFIVDGFQRLCAVRAVGRMVMLKLTVLP